MKVLVADDHLPDDSLTDDEIPKAISKQYPHAPGELTQKVVFMRRMTKKLVAAGFDVTTCNRASQVHQQIEKEDFDVAVIDLGWFADMSVPAAKRDFKGWDIIDEIKSTSPELPLIMYSNRLLDKQDGDKIANGAKDREVLAVYKDFNDICINSLIAAIRFLAGSRARRERQLEEIDLETYRVLSKITRYVFYVAFVFVPIGVGLLLSGIIQAGVLTSAISAFTTVMSGLFWKYLKKMRRTITS